MKKLLRGLVCLLPVAVMLLAGCSTMPSKGRISLLRWDSRSPEQLEAYKTEASMPYGVQATPAVAEPKAMPAGWWDALMKMITGIRVNLSLVSGEWSTTCPCPTCAAKIAEKHMPVKK